MYLAEHSGRNGTAISLCARAPMHVHTHTHTHTHEKIFIYIAVIPATVPENATHSSDPLVRTFFSLISLTALSKDRHL